MAQQVSQDRVVVALLYLLTAVTGLVDAVSFIGLGHVFTANMTGNVVFFGFASVGTAGVSVERSFAALGAYLIGALLGGRFASRLSLTSSGPWTSAAFATEAVFLLGATLASIGYRSPTSDTSRLYSVISLTALAMGLRNATVRKLGVADLTTTVLTMTITGLAADSSLGGGSNPRWQRRVLSILCMFIGAATGALLLRHSLALPLGVAMMSAVCGAAVFYGNRNPEGPGTRTSTKVADDLQLNSNPKRLGG
jgi:uncharacterized membrane protein YoaK (UPF0700 family)